MSSLAETHLRQGRSFLRAGDSRRAVELLEKARALARDDRTVLRAAICELARAYEQVGDAAKAGRCREQLEFLGNEPTQPQGADSGGASLPMLPTTGRKRRRWPHWATAAMIVVTAALHVAMFVWFQSYRARNSPPPSASGPNIIAVAPNEGVPAALPTSTSAVPMSASATQPHVGLASPLELAVRQNVALLVVLGHYEGRTDQGSVSVDMPLGTGTAFIVTRTGVLLTNRHVVDVAKGPEVPASLEELGMPTVTLRSTSYLACFGSQASQQFKAKLEHTSDTFDAAVLTTGQTFTSPLALAKSPPRLGDEVFVAGYPGIVQEMFDRQFLTDARLAGVVRKLRASGKVSMVSEFFSPDAFNATVTRGVISTAERHLDGVAHAQFDARVSSGNSGGPVMNSNHQVVAIVTKGGTGGAEGYNFGLLLDQMRDELAQWLEQK
jgi:S1-C subfamily serine protease